MTTLSLPRRCLFAGAVGAFLSAVPAVAQQPSAESPGPSAAPAATPSSPTPAAAPAGSPLSGRPDTPGAARLAPIAPPVFPLAADRLPVDKLRVPKGFRVEVFAAGVPDARSLRIGDNGTVFVGSRRLGKVHAVVTRDGKREVKPLLEGLHRPNGLAYHNGTLYVAELAKIWRYDNIEKTLDQPDGKVIYDNLPTDEPHGWKFIAVGPDNKLYVPVGAPCNICEPSQAHAQIRRINLDGSGMEVVARGVRNTVGFDWHPGSRQLFFTDNGRDWMSEDVPHDELNRVTRTGEHFGFPFCHQGNLGDTEFGWGRSCAETAAPIGLLGPHSAALGMRFYTGSMFPAEYRNAIFIARHGSWNKTTKTGGDIVVVKLNRDGTVRSMEPFMTGFIENNAYLGRPVDVQMMKDGSLLVSDDYAGAIYRISYGTVRPSSR